MHAFTCISNSFTQVFNIGILFVFIEYINIYIVPVCWTCSLKIAFNNSFISNRFNMSYSFFLGTTWTWLSKLYTILIEHYRLFNKGESSNHKLFFTNFIKLDILHGNQLAATALTDMKPSKWLYILELRGMA